MLTRTELDYGALSELDIRVETTADNGFRREDDLEVRVTDAASSQPQPDFTCPPVELIVFDEGVVGPTWDPGFGARYLSETGWATCENDGGAGCPGISWLIVDDDSRGRVLEITNAPTNSYSDRFYIKAGSPVDLSRFEGGTLEFDVRIISSDPEFRVFLDCARFCPGNNWSENLGAVVGSDWVTLSVNVNRLFSSDALHTVETGFDIHVTNGANATFRFDRVRWVADPDYDRIDGSGGEGSGK